MTLKVHQRIPYGNSRDVRMAGDAALPEVHFTPDPRGGPEALWFCFRLVETDPAPRPDQKVKLVLHHFQNLYGATDPAVFQPVYKPAEQGWFRMGSGRLEKAPDGRYLLSWIIPYPQPQTEVAFCIPYGETEAQALVDKSRNYWKADTLGLAPHGGDVVRLSNDYAEGGATRTGFYMLARQNPGDTSGSWALDGALKQVALIKHNPFLIWAVPLADPDGVGHGDYANEHSALGMSLGWGAHPQRHENRIIQQDMLRWKERCKPALVIDFRAGAACAADGVHCRLPDPARFAEAHQQALKWANVISNRLGKEYAAPDFVRVEEPAPCGQSVMSYACAQLGISALTIVVPYALAGQTVLSTKLYREIGARITDALAEKRK